MQQAFVLCFLVLLFCIHVYCNRELKQLRVNWSERDGFSLISNLLDISVNDDNVNVDSSIGTLQVDKGAVTMDSQLLKLETHQSIIAEVDNGKVMKLESRYKGEVDLSIGEEDEMVEIRIRPQQDNAVKGEFVLVDFSSDSSVVTVAVGENGQIVNVHSAVYGAQISEDRKIAKVNLTKQDVGLDIDPSDRANIEAKRRKKANSERSEAVSYVQVSGSHIISSSSHQRF